MLRRELDAESEDDLLRLQARGQAPLGAATLPATAARSRRH